ncbi:HepT-like ribonuclease domain-containing protein [Agrococcus casei]|uniref:DUF86 domain-containing protein n=1 Tax=Agrococcus casei LMG 22410 TaxID=1255656 RepID=A0A1R4G3V5_9MICO|nr:HepT-like ribonuclease domain-containing protein [Agrococcus casei]SJM62767.1 hypothetical protein CZ674_08545 [Agrococcus casei LMG 22410]
MSTAEREARIDANLAAIELHLQECVSVAARGEDAFFGSDFVYRYAAYAALIQVGNAVKDLPDEYRAAHPDVRWRALSRTRDKVGHSYGNTIDWRIIWVAVVNDIPDDLAAVTAIRAGRG